MTAALATTTSNAESLSDKVDAAIHRQMKDQKIPGLSLAVVRDGKIVKSAGYVMADVELHVPVRPQTIFAAGSITKQFTASDLMLLVEDGRLDLDDNITKFFPEEAAGWESD